MFWILLCSAFKAPSRWGFLLALHKNPHLALVYHIRNKTKNVQLLSGLFGKKEIELFVRMWLFLQME